MRFKKGMRRTTALLTAILLAFGTLAAPGAGEVKAAQPGEAAQAEETPGAQPQAVQEEVPQAEQPEAMPETSPQPEPVQTEATPETALQPETEQPEATPESVPQPEPVQTEATLETAPQPETMQTEATPETAPQPETERKVLPEGNDGGTAAETAPGSEEGPSVHTAGDPTWEEAADTTAQSGENALTLELRDAQGEPLPVSELKVPELLTSAEVTHEVDYRDGVYKVEAPAGAQAVCLYIKGLPEDAVLEFGRWNGYLAETEENWLLYPDKPIRDAAVRRGDTFTLEWEKFAVDPADLTLEQMDVYGALDADCDYAEVFVNGQDLSVLFLIERTTDDGSPEGETELSPEGAETELLPAGAPEDPEAEPSTETEPGETEAASEAQQTEELGITPVLAASPQEVKKAYEAAGKNLADSANQYTPQVASINGEWQILGLVRSGQAVDASLYSRYVANVINTLKESSGVLHEAKYTEYSRVVLALTALGEDVTNIGGYNLLAPLADFDQTVWQGINGAIFALIAFDSHHYEIPAAPAGKKQTTRENLVALLLEREISGGGWALSGNTADADMTAMALQALAPYREKDSAVKAAVERGVAKLSAMQTPDGGYGSWNTANSESCAQVIVALTALGIDPATDARFIKNGNSVVDALLGFSRSDGSFSHEQKGSSNQMSTEQAYYALTAYYRFQDGKTSLYDMSDVVLKSDQEKADQANTLLAALPAQVTLADKERVQAAQTIYNSLTDTQKSLVSAENVKKLQDALSALARLEAASGGSGGSGQNSGSNNGANNNANNGNSGKNPSSTKKPTGSTKKVNLTSGTGSAGTGAGAKTTVTGASAAKKTGESEKETETEKESETERTVQAAKGGTKVAGETKAVLADIDKLFRKSGGGLALPELAADYTDEQLQAIVAIYQSLESLTDEERQTVEKSPQYEKYLDTLDKVGERNHFDDSSGTDMLDNAQETLPWHVRLEVEAQDGAAACQEAVRAALKEQGEAFALEDIHFVDMLDGSEWHPQDVIRVSVPAVDLGDYENMAVVHIRDDGALEFLEGHISGSNIEFDTDEFSVYGIVGFHGSLEELMEDEPQVRWWLYAAPGALAAALLVLVLILRRKRER